MVRHFDDDLKKLKSRILEMGAMAEDAIVRSVESLKNRDAELAQKVIDDDVHVDQLELLIDDMCVDLIARFQPMAKDLRFITSAMKLNGELERIVDLCVDIATRTLEMVDLPLLKPLIDIPKLQKIAQDMVRLSIQAFLEEDVDLAKVVIVMDAEADRLRDDIQKELIDDYMAKDASSAPRAVRLLLIARFLERMCDHTTNIAEDVIFMVEGKVVKHTPDPDIPD